VPSIWYENSPLVIREAFAMKIPVIATNLGDMSEVVRHGKNRLLFDRCDPEDLARKIQLIIDEPNLITKLKSGIQTIKTS
jgi:glycosyltransferase involved in cell wall biosynthesis